MPRIPDVAIDSVFYLYKTRKAAEIGEDIGGTGFFVSMPSPVPGFVYNYAITNWHNAVRSGASVIRVNTVDGKTDIFDQFAPEDWLFIPKSHDIAAINVVLNPNMHRVTGIPDRLFVTKETIAEKEIGVGEDAFMIGRFVDHDGGLTNLPASRFGNISVMPTPITQETGGKEETYCLDMHSRTGYSGSPVFVYRTPGGDLNHAVKTGRTTITIGFLYLLGVHWGQFPEKWKGRRGKKKRTDIEIHGLSGMTLVAPAWAITQVLNLPYFVSLREAGNVILNKRHGNAPIAESADDNTANLRDETLHTMLSTSPKPRKKSSAKQFTSK